MLHIPHDPSTPYRPQTNGVAERAVRRVKEGTACALAQSGFIEDWWSEAMECYSFLRNIVDILKDGKTAFEKRFGESWYGPCLHFGELVEYQPDKPSAVSRCHRYGNKTLPGIFVGYKEDAGGRWSGELKIVDVEELSTAADIEHVYVKHILHKQVYEARSEQGQPSFPLAEGKLTQSGTSKTFRRERLLRPKMDTEDAQQPQQEEEEEDPNDDPEPKVNPQDYPTLLDPPEAVNQELVQPPGPDLDPLYDERDYWSMTNDTLTRVHRTPGTELFVPEEFDPNETDHLHATSCPFPTEYLDVWRLTKTDIHEIADSEVLDFRFGEQRSRELPDSWTGTTTFDILRPQPKKGQIWQDGVIWTVKPTTRPDYYPSEIWGTFDNDVRKKLFKEFEEKYKIDRDFHRLNNNLTTHIPAANAAEYQLFIDQAETFLRQTGLVPAMPVIEITGSTVTSNSLVHTFMASQFQQIGHPAPRYAANKVTDPPRFKLDPGRASSYRSAICANPHTPQHG